MTAQNDKLAEPLLPPPELVADPKIFKDVGEEFRRYFIELGGLQPDDAVLDVGSGNGRMAVVLTGYLSDKGRYAGFDVNAPRIHWCQENITPRFPNFRFHLTDARNEVYNPKGAYAAAEYRFPFGDREFDFVFLTSVFTHMLPGDLQHYLSEIARVMKKGARGLVTYFILNPEAEGLIASGRSPFTFPTEQEQARVDKHGVAYQESFLREIHGEHGLPIRSTHYGRWPGREEFLSFQDIVICERD